MAILGHGIDAVDIARIQRMLSDHTDRFLDRCFTPEERARGQSTRRYAQHIAARFAAKEAAMKALGTGLTSGVAWTDFSVRVDAAGRPLLHVSGKAAEIAQAQGISRWHVSLTHTDSLAIASVIAEG
jgi:holo-[acyl-carrier protein] synthase